MTEDCTAKYEEKTYSQGDHAIIETCNFSGCDRALTITLPEIDESYTYTGAGIRPLGNEDVVYSIGGNTIAFDTIPADDRVPVQYENNANAGTAKAYITKGGVRAERPFTINPASIAGATVELKASSEKYTGGDLTPTVAVTYSGIQLTEHTDYEISWHPANVVDVGTYQIKIKGNGNFKDEATLNQTFTITRATPTAANFVLTPPTSLTYDGGEKKATVAVAEGIVGMGNVTAVHYFNSAGEEVETPTAVDTYTVKVDVAEGGNYEAITGLTVGSFTIEKATPTFTAPTAKELTYEGEPQDLVEAGSVNPGKLLYRLDDGEYSETVPTATNAGNYTVYYKVIDLDTDNYNEVPSGSVSVTIRKAEAPDITFPEVLNAITYGQKLEEAKLSFYENEYGTFNWNAPAAYPGKAGTGSYALDFYPNELALQNYEWKDVGEAQWIADRKALCICPNVTVNKAPATVTAPTPKDLTYPGENQTLIAEGAANGGTLVYSLEKEGTYTAELPKAKTAGIYHVWYKVIGDDNHTDSDPAFIEAKIDKADPGIGAVTSGVVNDTLETSAIVLTRENTDIDGNLTVDAEQTLAFGDNSVAYTFTPHDSTNYMIVRGEVTVTVADTIAPTGTVTVSTRSWAEFLNTITFGLFFKETQSVSVNGSDNLSGVAKIEYIESGTAMDLEAVKAATQWKEMQNGSVSVTLEDAKQFIYYIRITDHSGNIAYLSSDGAEYDTTAPVIEGVNNGTTCYTTQTVTVTDKNIDTITLNGETAGNEITLDGNKEATYTITATDKAGNSTTVTVTMKLIRELAKATEELTHDNVTSADAPVLQELIAQLDELIADPDTSDDGERETLEQHKVIAEELLKTIEDAAKATDTENTEKVKDVTADNVTPEDKTDLEKAKTDLEKALEDNGGNYTGDEKKAIEDELGRIDDALEVIGNAEAVEELIDKLPDTIKKEDEAAVKAADDAYHALSDHGKSLVDEDAKKTLDAAKAALTALNKPAGTTSPGTGDDSSLWLWFVLLFISGVVFITLATVDGKKRVTGKR